MVYWPGVDAPSKKDVSGSEYITRDSLLQGNSGELHHSTGSILPERKVLFPTFAVRKPNFRTIRDYCSEAGAIVNDTSEIARSEGRFSSVSGPNDFGRNT